MALTNKNGWVAVKETNVLYLSVHDIFRPGNVIAK
jgi:hypothetical protein